MGSHLIVFPSSIFKHLIRYDPLQTRVFHFQILRTFRLLHIQQVKLLLATVMGPGGLTTGTQHDQLDDAGTIDLDGDTFGAAAPWPLDPVRTRHSR